MKIAFAGTPEIAATILQSIIKKERDYIILNETDQINQLLIKKIIKLYAL